MNTRIKTILMAGALIAAASSVAQAADQTDTSTAAASTVAPITVTGQRLSVDQRITNDVVDKIQNDPSMPADGYIGVETNRRDVTLTGHVDLPDQVDKAGLDAESVRGVRDVDNIVRPAVGGNF